MSTDHSQRYAARELWRVIEPFHQLAYRSDEAVDAYRAIGLQQPQEQYFASRLAALGEVSLPVATAVLYGFSPRYVSVAIPHVWTLVSPSSASAAREAGAQATLHRVLGPAMNSAEMTQASRIARRAVETADFAGRPIAAAHTDLAWPKDPAMQLWHACTVLREYRGDAHWAVTSAEGIDGTECHILHAADGAMPGEMLQRVSGWNEDEWQAATQRLVEKELVLVANEGLALTAQGEAVKMRIEYATDDASWRSFAGVGAADAQQLRSLMAPWVKAIMDAGVIDAWKTREELWRNLYV